MQVLIIELLVRTLLVKSEEPTKPFQAPESVLSVKDLQLTKGHRLSTRSHIVHDRESAVQICDVPRNFLALEKKVRVEIACLSLGRQLSSVHYVHKWLKLVPIKLEADHRRHPSAIHELLQVAKVLTVVPRVHQVLEAAEKVEVLLDAANHFFVEGQDQLQHVIYDVYTLSMLSQAHRFLLIQLHRVIAEMLHLDYRSEAPLLLVRGPLHEQVCELST